MAEKSLFCGINRKGDEAEVAMKEKHLPGITVPEKITAGQAFEVKLDCWGGGKHPNEHGHFIQWVELYAGDVFLTRVEFTPVVTSPVASITANVYHAGETTLRAVSRCNLHGLWESTLAVNAVQA
jgi:superoxide reductase